MLTLNTPSFSKHDQNASMLFTPSFYKQRERERIKSEKEKKTRQRERKKEREGERERERQALLTQNTPSFSKHA